MLIRWALDTVELDCFPGQARKALMQLRPGTFTAITISTDTQFFVKRLTERAFQLGAANVCPASSAKSSRQGYSTAM
jgi:hypothetical protein